MPDLICEHCGAYLSLEGMPMDAIDAIWKCPKCEGVITEKSYKLARAKEEEAKKDCDCLPIYKNTCRGPADGVHCIRSDER